MPSGMFSEISTPPRAAMVSNPSRDPMLTSVRSISARRVEQVLHGDLVAVLHVAARPAAGGAQGLTAAQRMPLGGEGIMKMESRYEQGVRALEDVPEPNHPQVRSYPLPLGVGQRRRGATSPAAAGKGQQAAHGRECKKSVHAMSLRSGLPGVRPDPAGSRNVISTSWSSRRNLANLDELISEKRGCNLFCLQLFLKSGSLITPEPPIREPPLWHWMGGFFSVGLWNRTYRG